MGGINMTGEEVKIRLEENNKKIEEILKNDLNKLEKLKDK